MKHLLFLLIVAVIFLSGCRKPSSYEVALFPDETLNRGDKVYLEGEPVAEIQEFYLVGNDQPVARIQLLDRKFETQFIRGIQRKPERGEIHLIQSPTSDPDQSKSLIAGSRIDIRSNPVPPSLWPPNQNTVILCGIVVIALVVVFFIFRAMIRVTLTVIALTLAAGTSWITYPFAIPYAQQAIELANTTAEAEVYNLQESGEVNSSIDEALQKISGFIKREDINPVYVSFGGLMLIYFIFYSVILGWARRRLTSKD